ncbi:MAG: Hsp20/alpha crystallin family protein [Thermodesulfobacteriota bacterium]|jgi:HSP20 family protein
MAWELINTNPFKEIEKARSEMDRLWDTFLFGRPQEIKFQEKEEWQPAIDVTETKKEIIVSVEIPGMNPEEIDITLSGRTLTFKGEKKQGEKEKEENYHIIERSIGSFTRSIALFKEVESDKISASYKDGVLKVTLPKSNDAKKKQIKIKIQ